MSMILRVANTFLTASVYDKQMAITQILLRNGWESGIRGKPIKKVKTRYQYSPTVYTVEQLPDAMFVKNNKGQILSKINLEDDMTNAQILDAAKKLHRSVPHTVTR